MGVGGTSGLERAGTVSSVPQPQGGERGLPWSRGPGLWAHWAGQPPLRPAHAQRT